MATSDTEIANLALSNLGVGKAIANLTTERSAEAAACRAFFNTARDAVLRDFDWSFARRYASLALIEENPNNDWGYSYGVPSDCIAVRRILSGTRNDTRQSRVPFEMGYGTSGTLLFTVKNSVEVRYTSRVTDYARFPPDFVLAFSWRLAGYMAPRLTGGDPFKLGPNALQMYALELSRAEANAYNNEQADDTPDAELVNARSGVTFSTLCGARG